MLVYVSKNEKFSNMFERFSNKFEKIKEGINLFFFQ